jgi:hypothetical protein
VAAGAPPSGHGIINSGRLAMPLVAKRRGNRMGPWTYYAPLWLGTLIAAVAYLSNLSQLPPWPGWVHVLALAGGCPSVGLLCQLVLFGAQGMFAQVLPVPRGKSIRGRGAVVSGVLLLGGIALAVTTVLLGVEQLRTAATTTGVLGLILLLAAAITYAWHIPAAVRDFGGED